MRQFFPLVLLTFLPMAAAAQEPLLPSDSRIKLLMYDDSDVYTINTRYGYQTNIVFDNGESVQTVSVGDRSMWQIIPAGNRMFIRPMQEGISTNMTVLTNLRSYQFDLKSVKLDADGSNIYVARFLYPSERDEPPRAETTEPRAEPVPPATPAMPATPAATGPGISHPVNPNYTYSFSGPDELAPQQVYDNGNATFFRLREGQAARPELYRVDSGGEQKLPYREEDGALAVDQVAEQWALRYTDGAVMIYNEMLNPK